MRRRKEQPERFTLAQGAYALLARYMALVLRIRGVNINIINDNKEFQKLHLYFLTLNFVSSERLSFYVTLGRQR